MPKADSQNISIYLQFFYSAIFSQGETEQRERKNYNILLGKYLEEEVSLALGNKSKILAHPICINLAI